jgi:hypothetical protein
VDRFVSTLLVSVPLADFTTIGRVGKLEGIALITYHFVAAWVVVVDAVQLIWATVVDNTDVDIIATLFE